MPYTDHALDVPEQTAVAAAAASAPSVLNAQPWLFATGPDAVEVRADPLRAPTGTASAERDVYLSCGAALFTVRAALARLGREVRVSVLPEARDPLLVARVAVTGDGGDPAAAALYRWVGERRTNRHPFRPEPVPAGVFTLLRGAAEREGATLRRLDAEPEYQRVLTLIRRASLTEDDAVREDRAARLTAGTPAVPVENLGPVPRREGRDGDTAVRDLAPGLGLPGRGTAAFEPHPELAVLETPRTARRPGSRRGRRCNGCCWRPRGTASPPRSPTSRWRTRICARTSPAAPRTSGIRRWC